MGNEFRKKRPDLLTALCILSFIGSGFAFIAYFIFSLFYSKFSAIIIKYSSWHSTEAVSSLYFTVLMVFFALSLVGAIRIWKGYRTGLFIYVFAQILILFLPVLWINWQAFSSTNAIFTIVFSGGYFLHWKWLK